MDASSNQLKSSHLEGMQINAAMGTWSTHEPVESIEHHERPSSNQRCAPTNRRPSLGRDPSTSIRCHLVTTRTAEKKACADRNATMVISEMATHQNGISNADFTTDSSRLADMLLCRIWSNSYSVSKNESIAINTSIVGLNTAARRTVRPAHRRHRDGTNKRTNRHTNEWTHKRRINHTRKALEPPPK